LDSLSCGDPTQKVASNIRRFAELVNEMGVQSFHRDISAFLRKRGKTGGSIWQGLGAKVPARSASGVPMIFAHHLTDPHEARSLR
jgi:hypothetical protein